MKRTNAHSNLKKKKNIIMLMLKKKKKRTILKFATEFSSRTIKTFDKGIITMKLKNNCIIFFQ